MFKIRCVYYKRIQISKFFLEAFTVAKTNDHCFWTSKTLHRSNTVRKCFLLIPSVLLPMFFFSTKNFILVYFLSNFVSLKFFPRICVLDTEQREMTLKPIHNVQVLKKNFFLWQRKKKNIVDNYCWLISLWPATTIMNIIIKYLWYVVKFHIFDNKKNVIFYTILIEVGVRYFFFFFFSFLFLFLFFKDQQIKFTAENSVHHQKKPLSLKCAINDALIDSQSDKAQSLIGVCIEARISLWEGLS